MTRKFIFDDYSSIGRNVIVVVDDLMAIVVGDPRSMVISRVVVVVTVVVAVLVVVDVAVMVFETYRAAVTVLVKKRIFSLSDLSSRIG